MSNFFRFFLLLFLTSNVQFSVFCSDMAFHLEPLTGHVTMPPREDKQSMLTEARKKAKCYFLGGTSLAISGVMGMSLLPIVAKIDNPYVPTVWFFVSFLTFISGGPLLNRGFREQEVGEEI